MKQTHYLTDFVTFHVTIFTRLSSKVVFQFHFSRYFRRCYETLEQLCSTYHQLLPRPCPPLPSAPLLQRITTVAALTNPTQGILSFSFTYLCLRMRVNISSHDISQPFNFFKDHYGKNFTYQRTHPFKVYINLSVDKYVCVRVSVCACM